MIHQNFFSMALGLAPMVADRQVSAIFYDRVSTDKQDVERQQRMLAEYRQRLNLLPILVASDPDTSGSIPFAEREGGRAVLAEVARIAANGGPPGTVFVTSEQDRVGRDTLDIIATIRAIWQAGITPHFIANGGELPRTPDNEFKMELNASFAQLERNRIRQRITAKMAGKRAAGELCGQLSYGFNCEYRFRDGTVAVRTDHALTKAERDAQELIHGPVLKQILVANLSERHWLRKMHALRQAGWGYHSIAKFLNQKGVPTKRAGEVMVVRRPSLAAAPQRRPTTVGLTGRSAAGAGEMAGRASAGRRPDEGRQGNTIQRATSGRWNCGQIKNVLESKTARQILES